MGSLGVLMNLAGVVFLAHAVYSAYEHSLIFDASATIAEQKQSSVLPRALDPKINLPVDIVAETLLSVLLLCAGVVLSSPGLKPIQWSTWAGNLEKDKSNRVVAEAGQTAGNPYAALEERPGFLDVRGARKGFADWVKEDGSKI